MIAISILAVLFFTTHPVTICDFDLELQVLETL